MKHTEVICVDLDGTLCNDSHRHHLAPPPGSPKAAWRAYHMACADDMPIEGTLTVVKLLAKQYPIYLITGRQEVARELTEAWLTRYGVPYQELQMLDPTKQSPGTKKWEYKVRYIEELRRRNLEPILFIEDWPKVAEYIEGAGVPVLTIDSRFPKLYDRPGET